MLIDLLLILSLLQWKLALPHYLTSSLIVLFRLSNNILHPKELAHSQILVLLYAAKIHFMLSEIELSVSFIINPTPSFPYMY